MKEIRPLTSLRGLAAMAVVMQHFSATAQLLTTTTIPSLVPHGYVAVDFFFVLSGFIMCYTYLAAFQHDGWRALPAFIAKRVIRLAPLNTFVVLSIILLVAASVAATGRNLFFSFTMTAHDIGANLLMLQGLGVGHNMNGPSWSVSTEFAAYFLFPAFIFVVFHRSRAVFAAAVGAALLLLGYVSSQYGHLALTAQDPLNGSLRCFSEFLLGMASYRLYGWSGSSRWLRSDPLLAGLLGMCAVSLVLGYDLPAAAMFVLVVPSAALNTDLAGKILSWRLFHFLGVISYAAYLIHDSFRPVELTVMRALHPAPMGPAAALTFAFIGSLSVIPFAWMCYRLVERPSRTYLRRRLLGKAA